MPTPGGLPKVGEVWEHTFRLPPEPGHRVQISKIRAVVLERSRGDYWSLRVGRPGEKPLLWVDASYWLRMGELKYIGPAGTKTKKALGLA